MISSPKVANFRYTLTPLENNQAHTIDACEYKLKSLRPKIPIKIGFFVSQHCDRVAKVQYTQQVLLKTTAIVAICKD